MITYFIGLCGDRNGYYDLGYNKLRLFLDEDILTGLFFFLVGFISVNILIS